MIQINDNLTKKEILKQEENIKNLPGLVFFWANYVCDYDSSVVLYFLVPSVRNKCWDFYQNLEMNKNQHHIIAGYRRFFSVFNAPSYDLISYQGDIIKNLPANYGGKHERFAQIILFGNDTDCYVFGYYNSNEYIFEPHKFERCRKLEKMLMDEDINEITHSNYIPVKHCVTCETGYMIPSYYKSKKMKCNKSTVSWSHEK